eukprot:jgi/Tetstr1/436749/TSEL_025530.t2
MDLSVTRLAFTAMLASLATAVLFRKRIARYLGALAVRILANKGISLQADSVSCWKVQHLNISIDKGLISQIFIEHAALSCTHWLWDILWAGFWRSGCRDTQLKALNIMGKLSKVTLGARTEAQHRDTAALSACDLTIYAPVEYSARPVLMQDTSVSWESVRVQLDSDFGGLIDSLALTKQQRGTSGSKPDSEESGRHDLHTKYHAVHKLAHTAYLAASSQDLRLLAAIGAAFLDRHSMKARKRREVPTKLPGASGRMKTVQSVRFDVRSLELMYTSSPVLSKYTAGEENQTRFLIGGTISATDLSLDYTSSKCTMDCSVLKWGCSPCKSRLCEAPSTCEDHMDVRAAKICWDCTDGGVPTCLVATSSIQASLGFITPLIFLKMSEDAKALGARLHRGTTQVTKAEHTTPKMQRLGSLVTLDLLAINVKSQWPGGVTAEVATSRIYGEDIMKGVSMDGVEAKLQDMSVATCQHASFAFSSADTCSNSATDTLKVCLDTVDLRLPHELQLGTHIRDISVSLAAMRSFLQGTKEHSSKNKSRALDVILSLTTVTVRACLPPWEAWLSSHSKALSSARSGILIMDHAREAGEASLQGLSQPWRGRSVPTTEPSAAAGAGLSTIPNADTACLEWRLYRGAKELLKHDEALAENCSVKIALSSVKVTSSILPSEGALNFISSVDASSAGVLQSAIRFLHVDCSASSARVWIGGVPEELVKTDGVRLVGQIAMAKQAVRQAEQISLLVPLHSTLQLNQELSVPAKFCRPPWKLYTDLKADLQKLEFGYSNAMQPLIKLAINSLRRVTAPSAADYGGVASSAGVRAAKTFPWWDRLRYQWRGKMSVHCSSVCGRLAFGLSPNAKEQEHLFVQMGTLQVKLGQRRQVSMSAKELEACGMPPPRGSCTSWLQFEGALPLIHFPVITLDTSFNCTMPGGRAQDAHYLWPALHHQPSADDSSTQGPVIVADLFRAEQIQVTIAIELAQAQPSELGSGSSLPHPQHCAAATLFIGERQLLWAQYWIRKAKNAPVFISQAGRIREFKAPRRVKDPTAKSIPRLVDDLDISATVVNFEVYHCANDFDDPSSRLHACCDNLSLTMSLKRQSAAQARGCSAAAATVSKQPPMQSARPWVMEALLLDLINTRVILTADGGTEGATPHSYDLRPSSSKERMLRTLFSVPPPSPGTPSTPFSNTVGTGGDDVINVATFSLKKQSPLSVADSHRNPLKMLIQDARLYINGDTPDAVVSMLDQLSGAFGPEARGTVETESGEANRDGTGCGTVEADVDGVMLTVDLTVHHFQMVIHSLEKNGQFLVCADTAQLQGTRGSVLEAPTPCEARRAAAGCPRLTRSELVFSMERMQGYITQTDIDPSARVRWLAVTNGTLAAPPSSLVKQVLQPARVEVRMIKDRAPRLDMALNSREFGIMASCGAFMSMIAPPKYLSLIAHERHLMSSSRGSNDKLDARRQDVLQLRQHLGTLKNVVHELGAPGTASEGSSSLDVSDGAPLAELHSSLSRCLHDAARLANSQSQENNPEEPSHANRSLSHLVLRCGQLMHDEAVTALHVQEGLLFELAMQEKRRAAKSPRSGENVLSLEVAHVGLSLLQDGDKPWVRGGLDGISFARVAKVDKSGTIQASIRKLELHDAEGRLPATKGTGNGVILAHWDPSPASENDPTLTLHARHGPHTSGSQLVMQHLEVVVHPLGMHLTQALASQLNEYFELASADTHERRAARAEEFASTLQNLPRIKPHAPQSSTQAQADVGRDLQDLEADSEPDGDADAPLGLAKRGSVSLHSSPKKMAEAESMEAAEPAAASQARRHRRTVSDMSVLSTTETSSLSSGLGAKYSIGGDSEEWRPAPISIDNLSGADTAQGPATPAKKSVIRFAHVRMNQVNLMITYAGGPVTIRDWQIVLDTRVYKQHVGRWHDLMSRLKWDIIKSVVKSMAGLQGNKLRKIRQALPTPPVEPSELHGGQEDTVEAAIEGAIEDAATTSTPIADDGRKAWPPTRAVAKPLAWMGSMNKALFHGSRGAAQEPGGSQGSGHAPASTSKSRAPHMGRSRTRAGRDPDAVAVSDAEKERLLFGTLTSKRE